MKRSIKSYLRRSFVLLCTGVLAVSLFSSCKKEEESNYKPGADGTSKDFKTFETVEPTDYSISFYWGPNENQFTEADIKLMKDAGFDIVPIQRFSDKHDKIKEVVNLLEKQGLKAAVCDDRITKLYNSTEIPTQEAVDAAVQDVLDFYKDCTNITEWIVCDEPSADKFDVIARISDAIRRLSPEDKVYVNLFPSYASRYDLGTNTYTEYLETFCEKVNPDYISFDYYDFLGGDFTETHRGGFVQNLADVTSVAKKYNKETRVIVLLTKHGDYSNVSQAEINWQSNLSLLFGMKSLSFFTYSVPDDPAYVWEHAMVDRSGKATDHYEAVKTANVITRAYGDALYNTKVDKVFSINNEYTSEFINGIETYTSYGDLGEVKEGIDMMVSFYENGTFMVMNGNSEDGNPRKLVTKDLTENLQWFNTFTRRWETVHSCFFIEQNADGAYQITLIEGNAVLLRVGKQVSD